MDGRILWTEKVGDWFCGPMVFCFVHGSDWWIETTSMVVNATSSQHHRQRLLALADVLLGQEQEVGLK